VIRKQAAVSGKNTLEFLNRSSNNDQCLDLSNICLNSFSESP
jgi:hypothetical protein